MAVIDEKITAAQEEHDKALEELEKVHETEKWELLESHVSKILAKIM